MDILVLANHSIVLYKFRKELLVEMIKQKHKVYVCFPKDKYVDNFLSIGCKYIEVKIDRRGTNPIKDINLLVKYITIIKKIKPNIVLTYTIKPNIYGGIACRIAKVPYLVNITGLGTSIEDRKVFQYFILKLYKIALKKAKCVFFQNQSNLKYFLRKKIVKGGKLIPGSGVNLFEYKLEEYPSVDSNIKFLFIGRIMKEKGIDELLQVSKIIKNRHENIEFNILGFCEEKKYKKILRDYDELGYINYHGYKDDVREFVKSAHAVILPSYHEGTSNVLLEAASMGRPVLASNVPGCIETFDDGVSGYSFNPKNVESIIGVVEKFIYLPYQQKKTMGLEGRKKMEKEYDRKIVIEKYMNEIKN